MMKHVLIFLTLDTYQIVTQPNLLWSHNLFTTVIKLPFNVDSCYDILQHLLLISMPNKSSVIYQAKSHHTSSTCRNILRFLTFKQNINCLELR